MAKDPKEFVDEEEEEDYEPQGDCPGCGLMQGHTEGCEHR